MVQRISSKDEAMLIYEENRAMSDRFKKYKNEIIGVWETVSNGYSELINLIPCDEKRRRIVSIVFLYALAVIAFLVIFPLLSGFTKLTFPELSNLFFLFAFLAIVVYMSSKLLGR